MRKRRLHLLLKLSLVMSFVFVAAFIVSPVISRATSTSVEMEISNYRSSKDAEGNYTSYPDAPDGYVFGGWYKNADCEEAISSNTTTGKAWAKWVKKEVLGVKYQVSNGTTASSTSTNVRLITSVDTLKYREAGFVLNVGEIDSKPAMSNIAYANIKGTVNGAVSTYYPNQVFDGTSTRFVVYEVKNIPQSVFDTDIKVTSRWKTLDGTVVTGTTNTVKISNTYADSSTTAEDGTVTVTNRDGNETVYCMFSGLDIKAGDTVTFSVNPSAGNANGWIGIEGFKDGASVDWDWQDNLSGTSYTNSFTAGGDRDTLKFLYKTFSGNLGDVTVSFKITIIKADQSTTAEDGTVTVTNRDGNETVYCTFSDLDIKAGDTVTFTVNPSAGNANGWIGIEGFKDGTSIDWDWQDNLSGTSYTNSYIAGGERDTLKFLYKTFNGNLGDVTVSFKITITKADQSTTAEDGTVTVTNRDGNETVYCTFSDLDIKAGDTVTFTVNPSAGNANGWIGIEGFKDGTSIDWDWQDNLSGTSYTNSFTAGGERDTLKFLYKTFNGNLGDVTVSFKITVTKAE